MYFRKSLLFYPLIIELYSIRWLELNGTFYWWTSPFYRDNKRERELRNKIPWPEFMIGDHAYLNIGLVEKSTIFLVTFEFKSMWIGQIKIMIDDSYSRIWWIEIAWMPDSHELTWDDLWKKNIIHGEREKQYIKINILYTRLHLFYDSSFSKFNVSRLSRRITWYLLFKISISFSTKKHDYTKSPTNISTIDYTTSK